MLAARDEGKDAFRGIERVLSWEVFSKSVKEAEKLAREEDFDPLELLTNHYSVLRRYSPVFLKTFEFKAVPAMADLLKAVNLLRQLNRDSTRKVPADAPTEFIRPRWSRHVMGPERIDRRLYEFCHGGMKNALRSGDVVVVGSRQFRASEEYLTPQLEFERGLKE